MNLTGLVRWLRAHPFEADTLLAGSLAVLALLGLTQQPQDVDTRDPDGVTAALTLLMTVPVSWRRRAPRLVLLVTGLALVAAYVRVDFVNVASLGPVVAIYGVGAHCDRRPATQALVITGVVTLAVLVAGVLHGEDITPEIFVSQFVIFGTAWILGDNVRTRRAYVAELEAKAARLDEDRRRQARRAVVEERARIARELHDVVAHSVSVMVVQAGAARRVLRRDPAGAEEALSSVEGTGRQALAELRRMLGMLRGPEGADADLAPQPGVERLAQLADGAREAGVRAEVETVGVPRPLPAGVDLTAYRIVQEALTNVVKHAGPARVHVRLTYLPDELRLEVLDDGRGAAAHLAGAGGEGGGHGIVGMRERVELFGGDLEAGPRAGGGFAVRARLPVERAAV